jgi:hypothetical protein
MQNPRFKAAVFSHSFFQKTVIPLKLIRSIAKKTTIPKFMLAEDVSV